MLKFVIPVFHVLSFLVVGLVGLKNPVLEKILPFYFLGSFGNRWLVWAVPVLFLAFLLLVYFRLKKSLAVLFQRLAKHFYGSDGHGIRFLTLALLANLLLQGLTTALLLDSPGRRRFFLLLKILTIGLALTLVLKVFDSSCRRFGARFEAGPKQVAQMLLMFKILVRFLILFWGILLLIRTLGYSIGEICATVGFGGALLAFLAKEAIGNVLSCLTLMVERPFQIGDRVRIPERQVEGTVELIGLRSTRIRTKSGSLTIVPNGLLTDVAIDNLSRMESSASTGTGLIPEIDGE